MAASSDGEIYLPSEDMTMQAGGYFGMEDFQFQPEPNTNMIDDTDVYTDIKYVPEVGVTDDLSSLSILDENVILDEIHARFKNEKYYTFFGDILVAVNPNKELSIYTEQDHAAYRGVSSISLPHIFWIANRAYNNLLQTSQNQCILVGGESGAGKTESTKFLVQHLAYLSSTEHEELHEKLLRVNPLLESFGNASTLMNDHSSRFGKFVELFFDDKRRLTGAKIHDYMLEKSRVVSRGPGEKNFHIFYYLFAGLSTEKLSYFHLGVADGYRIINPGENGQKLWTRSQFKYYKQQWQKQMEILEIVGFTEDEISVIITLLAVILHLTNIEFSNDPETEALTIEDEFPLQIVANLMSLNVEDLTKSLISRRVFIRGESFECLKTKTQAEDGRDALAKALYARLFGWIVGQINLHLKADDFDSPIGPSVGILDMSGFETLPKNGFEQLCINAANEQLHTFFNESVFVQEEMDYKLEEIDANEVHFKNNQPVVDLLFQKPTGIFHLIDEESTFPNSTDSTLTNKLDQSCCSSDFYFPSSGNSNMFGIKHYAGKVTYDADGMLERNRDNLSGNLIECVSNSGNEFVKALTTSQMPETGSISRSMGALKVRGSLPEISGELKRSESRNSISKYQAKKLQNRSRSVGSLAGTELKQSSFVSRNFRRSLSELMQKVSHSKPSFVRCLKPNISKSPVDFDVDVVKNQMQCNGLLEIAKIRRDGYAVRMALPEFVHRYRDISFGRDEIVKPDLKICEQILVDSGIKGYALGKTKVFLRHWHEPILQEIVAEKRTMYCSQIPEADSTEEILNEQYDPDDGDVTEEQKIEVVATTCTRPKVPPRPSPRSKSGGSCASSTSNFRVAEWINKSEKYSSDTDTKIPPYDPGPPPMFQKGTPKPHVRISLPAMSEHNILNPRLWDRFQMIPRERVSTGDTFRPFLKVFKLFCYLLLFCIVLTSAVVNRLCILLMTSSVLKDKKAENDSQSPTHTMLIISVCVPYAVWVLSYSAKSLFGNNAWPSFKAVIVTLFIELLHTVGVSMLVFHILPRTDMARGMIHLSGIYMVPAFLKTISVANNKANSTIKRVSLTLVCGLAFLIQFCNLAASTMFSVPLNEVEKRDLQREVVYGENINHSIERPTPTFGNRIMWEIPISLFLISLSYWENFVDGNISICSFTIPFLEWKKYLHSVRQRLYIFAGIWKAGWTMLLAALLLPGFSFNIHFSEVVNNTEKLAPTNSNTTALPYTTPGALYLGSGRNVMVKRDISNAINTKGISAVLNLTDSSLTNDKTKQKPTVTTKQDPTSKNKTKKQESSTNYFSYIVIIPENVKVNFQRYGPLYAQIISSALLSYFGSLACKMCMQSWGFSIPLFLATPLTLGVIALQCHTQFIPSYLYIWLCPESEGDLRLYHLLWILIVWISQTIVTSHIWCPKNGRMSKIERLFVTPLRCAIFTDQSLMLRRRTNDRDSAIFNLDDDMSSFYDDEDDDVHKADDVVPQIYACATMWHETRSEMTHLLKSLFRMDTDHSARYLAQKFYGIRDPDYYEFEAHIFFDDAMELSDDDRLVPNSFVAELIDCIDDALSSVHERQMFLGPPTRIPTPYGGRLVWRLPGGSKLMVHLKDKHKIRHKKRWSQVMYIYYLLGYKILANPENLLQRESNAGSSKNSTDTLRVRLTETQLRHRRQSSHFTRSVIFNYVSEEVHAQAENTFILSLDGDVDFKPDAVRLLVDRLKKNKKVGAACGRIHPVGSGPILWYQEFEYAIGHWLQKATEHVFGCVLCAPGCFSLFRGSALMDDNVSRSYAIRATEAGHYVQYDQGEDRWLSTLLLQQGYRIDYCAAADALTHAPETFSEFFNQRRRWGPSTLANIADLLGDWKNTVRLNDNISTPYVLYQFLLLVSTVLGPATVLLMIAGAFTVVFKTSVLESYVLALVPAIAFIVLCIVTKPETQIIVASILSACYALVMAIVLVGTVGTAIQGDLTSPNVVFLMMLVIIFFIAALMHPEEFACVIPGALYFICIPTGYLVLTIYYLCNLHVVSWGTREVPKRKSREEIEAEKRAEEEKRLKKERKKKGLLGWLGLGSVINEGVEMFRQLRTMTVTNTPESKSKTDELLEELIFELRQSRDQKAPPRHRSFSTMTHDSLRKQQQLKEQDVPPKTESEPPPVEQVPAWIAKENPDNPAWLEDDVCGEGPIRRLEDREKVFWKQLIKKYLYIINEDKDHQSKVAAELKNLRNNVVFGFFMTSALWIALTMQLQLLQDDFKETALFIKIPHFDPSKSDLTFEPLGMMFLALFSVILFVQFMGMFSHRWGTILHVLSITNVSCSRRFTEKHKIQEMIMKAMELQRVSNIENEPEPDYDDPIPDYDDNDIDDDDETNSSMYTDTSSSSISISRPPSYHSQDIPHLYKSTIRRRNSAVFNKRGMATGKTLRRAFERRYRNQLQRQKSGESSHTVAAEAHCGAEEIEIEPV